MTLCIEAESPSSSSPKSTTEEVDDFDIASGAKDMFTLAHTGGGKLPPVSVSVSVSASTDTDSDTEARTPAAAASPASSPSNNSGGVTSFLLPSLTTSPKKGNSDSESDSGTDSGSTTMLDSEISPVARMSLEGVFRCALCVLATATS